MANTPDPKAELEQAIQSVLSTIERPREADIITRRYGLNGERETLEQVGETLGITRERVRQIEKATLIRIKLSLDNGKNPLFNSAEMEIVKTLHEMGRAACVDKLTKKLLNDTTERNRAIVTLLAELSSKMLLTTENDKYNSAVVLTSERDDRAIKKQVDSIVKVLRYANMANQLPWTNCTAWSEEITSIPRKSAPLPALASKSPACGICGGLASGHQSILATFATKSMLS